MTTGAIWLRLIPTIWSELTSTKCSRLSSAPAPALEMSDSGKRQAIQARESPISGLSASGMETTRVSKNPPNMYRTTPPTTPMPELRLIVVSRTRARSGLWRIAQLCQRVGRRPREPKIEKSEHPEQNPNDRHHAKTRVADVAKKDRNRHKCDRDPRHRREEINDEIDLERSSSTYLSWTRDI